MLFMAMVRRKLQPLSQVDAVHMLRLCTHRSNHDAQPGSHLREQGALARRNVIIQDVKISLLGFSLSEEVQILPLLIGG